MTVIENKTFDMERALYGSEGLVVNGCVFDGRQMVKVLLKNVKI